MMIKIRRLALTAIGTLLCLLVQAQDVTREWVEQNYTKREVMIPMRDGVKLFTAIYEPIGATKLTPVITPASAMSLCCKT